MSDKQDRRMFVLSKVRYGDFDARIVEPVAVGTKAMLSEFKPTLEVKLTEEEKRNEVHYEIGNTPVRIIS